MTLSATALITLVQAKAHLHIDAETSGRVDAEYVGEGDASDLTFSLDDTPIDGSLQLYVNNVLQVETTNFSISGADITFVTAPTNGHPITASYDVAATSDTFESYDDLSLEEMIDAATKIAEDFSGRAFVQRSITEEHQGDGETTLRMFKSPVDSITSVVADASEALQDGDGSTVAWTIGDDATSGSIKVYKDGVVQTLTTDYTISDRVITFVTAPAADVKIGITYTHTIVRVSEYTEQLAKGRIIGAAAWSSGIMYTVTYVAGEGATRATTQALIPDAVTAVLLILSDMYEHRGDTVSSDSISGIGTTLYQLPSRASQMLARMRPLGGFV